MLFKLKLMLAYMMVLLVKRGEGTLVMTGNNSYRGGTTVEQGVLLYAGFSGSFGTQAVNVNGGKLGIIERYNDTFTQKRPINLKPKP